MLISRRIIVALGIAVALATTVLVGAAQAQGERVALEWDRWLNAQGDPKGALVFYIGDAELQAENSGIAANQAVPLASLSKAVTAQCIASLVAEDLLDWNDPLSLYLDEGGEITIAQLVTHTSGLWPDSTQGPMAQWRNDPTPRWPLVSAEALARSNSELTGFRYNNENYAILGLVIERVGGQAYAETCNTRVLAPLGITTARLSPVYGSYGPWGGWEMSVRDYATFLRASYAGTDPLTTPHADMGDGPSYGLGMVFRTGPYSANHWHFGLLCFRNGGIGAFAVNWAGRYTVVAAYDACVSWDAMIALDNALVRAVFAD